MKLKPTKEQKQIITHIADNAVVKAGPGCAKTSTLGLRAKSIIDKGNSPDSIVIITYSAALTEDIKKTLCKLLGDEAAKQIVVRTIHGFAYMLVNRHCQIQDEGKPSVLKASRKKRLIQRCAEKYRLKPAELNKIFFHFETGNAEQVITALGNKKAKLAKLAYQAYSRYKKKHNKIDFEDMIGQALQLLRSIPNPTFLLGEYQHLMVDELQDINGSQKELILELSKHMASTMLVGDPLQSIYGWRQASLRHWDELVEVIRPKQFVLTETFRNPKQCR